MARTRLYSTAVEGDYAFLDEMRDRALHINEQQIFSHIFLGRYKKKDVENLIEDIMFIRLRFQKERREIAEFAENYNSMYATDNNGCFSVVFKFCRLLRSTLKGAMAIFRDFCAKKSHKLICRDGKQVRLSVHTHSDLGAQYTQMLIPFNEEELIPPKLRELSNLLIDFFVEITDVLGICREVMSEEIKIRKDYPRLKKIYDDTIEEIQEMGLVALNIINCPDSIDKIENSMTREMLRADENGLDDILSKYFHKITLKQMRSHYMLLTAFKARYDFISTDKERNMWNENIGHIQKVRKMISCFDKLKPKGQKDSETGNIKLSGKWVAKLMHWAVRGHGIAMKDFVDYFNEEYRGSYQKIEYATIMAAYSGLKKEEKDACVIEFENFLNHKAAEEAAEEEEKQRTA